MSDDTTETERDSETVTVHVWQGGRMDSYEDLLEEEPDEYELEIGYQNRVLLAEDIEHHGTYAFDVPDDERPVTLNVHTNDSYHNPHEWGDPVERGLRFHKPDDAEPYQCEMWGRIMMWAERPEGSEDSE